MKQDKIHYFATQTLQSCLTIFSEIRTRLSVSLLTRVIQHSTAYVFKTFTLCERRQLKK